MKAISMLVFSAAIIAGSAGMVRADDMSGDAAAYKQKMHDCAAQMKTDHPDMNHDARRKACRKQLGPAPKMMKGDPMPTNAPPPPPAPTEANPTHN